jgi:hypothetical protein
MSVGLCDAAEGIAGGGIGLPGVWLGGSFVWTGLRLVPQSRQNRKESSFSRPQFSHLIIAPASHATLGRVISRGVIGIEPSGLISVKKPFSSGDLDTVCLRQG